ncbi:hypothetical protein NIES4073_11860 [Kalymmatonema gypsitolerans NIES-4073]|nr:hypothetical protein NIES4073_11860 [Scytonema sp. NIES-4073]
MNIKVLALAAILSFSAPAIIDIALNPQTAVAMPTDFVRPTGAFTDNNQEWVVKLNLDQFGIYTYEGQNVKKGSELTLKNPEMSGNSQSYTYSFKNENYKYIITYQPADTKHIRLTVVNPQGSTILNQLMAKV